MSNTRDDSPPTPEDRALRQQFLLGMSHAACTVNVVTTDGVAGRHGVTVSAMVSVSADTPQPTLLVCIHHLSPVVAALLENGVFCVNVLRDDQAHISDNFAGRSGAHGPAKFNCATWTTQVTGAPRVVDSLVAFDCRVTASERVGSHFVVFGSVQDIFVAGTGAPLIYANRAYGVTRRFHQRRSRRGVAAGTLAVGCEQVLAPYIVPALVARLTKLHPEIALTLVESDHEHLIASLRRSDTEIALLYDFGLGEDLQVERLAELTPYVLLPEGHPLSAASAVALQDLMQEPLVLLDTEPNRTYILSLFRDCGLDPPQIGYRSRSLEMVRGLVGHGLGYSLLATKPANNMTYDGRALVARPLSSAVKNSALVIAALRGRSLSTMAVEFADHCRSLFGINPAHPASHGRASPAQYAPGEAQS